MTFNKQEFSPNMLNFLTVSEVVSRQMMAAGAR